MPETTPQKSTNTQTHTLITHIALTVGAVKCWKVYLKNEAEKCAKKKQKLSRKFPQKTLQVCVFPENKKNSIPVATMKKKH